MSVFAPAVRTPCTLNVDATFAGVFRMIACRLPSNSFGAPMTSFYNIQFVLRFEGLRAWSSAVNPVPRCAFCRWQSR